MRSTRRDAVKALGITVAAVTLGGVERLAQAAVPVPTRRRKPDQLFNDLEGVRFGSCAVKNVGAVVDGSIGVTLVDAQGQSFLVEVLRDDPSAPGLAQAGSLAVYMKVGRSQKATCEEHGLATLALAAELGRREAAGAPVPRLHTLTERAAFRGARSRRNPARNA
jgi:hypothetical protein